MDIDLTRLGTDSSVADFLSSAHATARDREGFRRNSSKQIDFTHRLEFAARSGSRELRAGKIPASYDAWRPPKRRKNDSEKVRFFWSRKSVIQYCHGQRRSTAACCTGKVIFCVLRRSHFVAAAAEAAAAAQCGGGRGCGGSAFCFNGGGGAENKISNFTRHQKRKNHEKLR